MITERSKRLEKYLSDELGWATEFNRWRCSNKAKCHHIVYVECNFCSYCGSKMKKEKDNDTLHQLEEAISFALGEKK